MNIQQENFVGLWFADTILELNNKWIQTHNSDQIIGDLGIIDVVAMY